MTVPVSVNDQSTGNMSLSSEFNIAKSKLSISHFPLTSGVSWAVLIPADLRAQQWWTGVLTDISGNILGMAMEQRLSPVSIDDYHPYIIVIIILYKDDIS